MNVGLPLQICVGVTRHFALRMGTLRSRKRASCSTITFDGSFPRPPNTAAGSSSLVHPHDWIEKRSLPNDSNSEEADGQGPLRFIDLMHIATHSSIGLVSTYWEATAIGEANGGQRPACLVRRWSKTTLLDRVHRWPERVLVPELWVDEVRCRSSALHRTIG